MTAWGGLCVGRHQNSSTSAVSANSSQRMRDKSVIEMPVSEHQASSETIELLYLWSRRDMTLLC